MSLNGYPAFPRVLLTPIAIFIFSGLFDAPLRADGSTQVAGFLKRHCLDCHTGVDAEANLQLEDLHPSSMNGRHQQVWSMVHDRVSRGEMPPAEFRQPVPRERDEFLGALEDMLSDAERQRYDRYGRSELRRLSRAEYANSLKDLLNLPYLEVEEMLPPDGLAHGYAKSAQALDFSHVMVTRYLETADDALWQALARRPESLPTETIRAELRSVDGVTDTLQTLRVQLKQTTAMPLIGTRRDPTLE